VDEIWITFPDPQMKKVTKRLTSTYFMARYRQLLRPNGMIHLKTDSPFLYTYTQAMVEENQYPILVNTDNLYQATPSPNIEDARRLQTHYEKQWLDRGMTIKYIVWELPKDLSLTEPDIEIEKDNYRSYGRNYVSTTNH
jgi:tRNA (guanine-N7-)-methyltransferase